MTESPPTDPAGASDDPDEPSAADTADGPTAGGDGADDVAYDVPADATPAECEYCGLPFESEGLLALHRGRAHESAITGEQRSAYEDAYGAESGQLGRFRLKALAVLVVLYFGLLMVYAVV